MGKKKVKEKRKFIIHDREFWLRKDQIEKEFGCPPEDVEQIWQSGEKAKAEKPSKLSSAKPSKKPTEEEVLKEMKRLAANGVTEVSSRLISDKLGMEADKGRAVIRRAMKKLEADGKVITSQKAQGKKQYVYSLKE